MITPQQTETIENHSLPINENLLSVVHLKPIEGFADKLNKFGVQHTKNAGNILFAQYEKMNSIYVIQSGLVALEIISTMGETKTIGICPPGVILGEVGLFSDYISTSQSRVLFKSKINVLSIKRMGNKLLEDSDIVLLLFRSLSSKLQLSTNQLGIMMLETLQARIAHILLECNKERVFLTHETLSTIIGASRISVTRHLREMQEQGIIQTQRGSILIINRNALKKLIV
ncbi:MAG TPA: Crp/Fnr family transcriptional regulator [Anaerolineae bacterium]|nr:Crp/Fnr family transcriptional regulator [Anaerolineae bacterium]